MCFKSVFCCNRYIMSLFKKSAAKDTYRRVTLKTFRRFWGEKSWAGGNSNLNPVILFDFGHYKGALNIRLISVLKEKAPDFCQGPRELV